MYIEYIKSNIKTFDDVNFFNKKYINYICDNMGLYIYNTPFANLCLNS